MTYTVCGLGGERVKVGDLVQNIHNPVTNKESGEEVGVIIEVSPSGRQFKLVLLGETSPHRNWRMIRTYEVVG